MEKENWQFWFDGRLGFWWFHTLCSQNLAHKTHSGQQKPHLTLLQVNPYLKSFSVYLVHNLSILVSLLFGCFTDHFAPKIYSLAEGGKNKDMQSIFSTLLKINIILSLLSTIIWSQFIVFNWLLAIFGSQPTRYKARFRNEPSHSNMRFACLFIDDWPSKISITSLCIGGDFNGRV